MDSNATNYDPSANNDDGSCCYSGNPFELQVRKPSSPTATNGSVRVVYSNTTTPVTNISVYYAWSNGMLDNEVTGLGMGPIAVTITDSCGYTWALSIFIMAEPNPPNGGCMDPSFANYSYSNNNDCSGNVPSCGYGDTSCCT